MSKVVIPLGPQHPALKEPANFALSLDGERIIGAAVNLGYNHRGIEKACEQRNYTQVQYLLERICGICSHSHSTAFIQAVEEIAGIPAPRRAQWIRALVGELERLHSHLLWLGVAGHELGFDTLFMYSWRDRELVMDLLAQLTGNRVNYGVNKFGGVRRDISDSDSAAILASVAQLDERLKYYLELVASERTLAARMLGVGKLSQADALAFGASGPVCRAAGVDKDTRRDDPYAGFEEIPFEVITDDHADVYGRAVVRVKEMQESVKIIRYILANLPDGPLESKFPRRVPAGEAVSRYEAPRGEDVHYVQSNGSDHPERVKVRAPTLANAASIALMLQDSYLADAPIIIAAIDPCLSCTDRSIAVRNERSGESGWLDWAALRRYSIEWYRQRGVNFNDLNRKQ
ncbi:MAG: nickel-dependent hydrogenase large subunit [Actinomycetia bacterium]|nr:nickel-dependent hydrogenase large subunit [Actinomycetes bacterium]